jgi:hypothetical protein
LIVTMHDGGILKFDENKGHGRESRLVFDLVPMH